eukprot:TRINITY_DN4095_c0_g1_i1.p1 TRINITY_DN4095_c0_g1~~TRINITY_DN4095_c0_g1_i1.p1  ORF type:complete len:166 (-),score=34.68 TRINITY_DN4095_c0_g1_i1:166-663(-)
MLRCTAPSSMPRRTISSLAMFSCVGAVALLIAALLQGCGDKCETYTSPELNLTVCCPSFWCDGDNGCCMKDPRKLCMDEHGNGAKRLMDFTIAKWKASSGDCSGERANDKMLQASELPKASGVPAVTNTSAPAATTAAPAATTAAPATSTAAPAVETTTTTVASR